jgi:hypothetical protein
MHPGWAGSTFFGQKPSRSEARFDFAVSVEKTRLAPSKGNPPSNIATASESRVGPALTASDYFYSSHYISYSLTKHLGSGFLI